MPDGLTFSPSINALQVYGKCLSVEALNVTSGSAVAGRVSEEFVTTFDLSNGYSGVTSTSLRHLDAVGMPVPDQTRTHFSITGPGFAITKNGTDLQSEIGFVRDCTFDLDKNGNLVNNLGQFLQVFPVDDNGIPLNPDVTTPTHLQTLNITGLVSHPIATGTVSQSLQLPGGAVIGQPDSVYPQTVTVYDSLGIAHNLLFTWTKVAGPFTNAAATQGWTLTITEPGTASVIGGTYAAGSRVEFSGNGAPVAYDAQGGGANAANPPVLNIVWNNGSANSAITLNLGAVGSLSGVVSVGNILIPRTVTQDGSPPGAYSSMSIDPDGFVFIQFDNNAFEKKFRIPLARFANTNELNEISAGVFNVSGKSGSSVFSFPGEKGSGHIEANSVESSTVSPIKSYTDMIKYQHDYVSNVKAMKILERMWDAVLDL